MNPQERDATSALAPESAQLVETYFARVHGALLVAAAGECEETVDDLRTHVYEELAGTAGTAADVTRILAELGPPEALAAECSDVASGPVPSTAERARIAATARCSGVPYELRPADAGAGRPALVGSDEPERPRAAGFRRRLGGKPRCGGREAGPDQARRRGRPVRLGAPRTAGWRSRLPAPHRGRTRDADRGLSGRAPGPCPDPLGTQRGSGRLLDEGFGALDADRHDLLGLGVRVGWVRLGAAARQRVAAARPRCWGASR